MYQINIKMHEVFQALSDPHRIRIIRLMLDVNDVCLCELSDVLDEPEYKLSRHIKVLKSNGLINSVRDGKWIYHSLVKDKPFLKFVFRAIASFQVDEKLENRSLEKLKKRILVRENGKCRTPAVLKNERITK